MGMMAGVPFVRAALGGLAVPRRGDPFEGGERGRSGSSDRMNAKQEHEEEEEETASKNDGLRRRVGCRVALLESFYPVRLLRIFSQAASFVD